MAERRAQKKKGGGISSNTWEDHYTRLARKEGYAARSVYKLKEIQEKFSMIKKGNRILDLGCAPGSWMQYAAALVGSSGRVWGVDLKAVTISLPAHVSSFEGDIYMLPEALLKEIGSGVDLVMSDMAPDTMGTRSVDALRSLALSEAALAAATQVLKGGGHFICKIFQGEGFDSFVAEVRRFFKSQRLFKPQSCRKQSREIYVIGMEFTGKV